MEISISRILTDNRLWAIIIFVLAALIRSLPEILSGPYPVGYDLIAGYAPSMLALPETYPLKLFGWLWSPLSVFILWVAWKLSAMDLFTLLKFAGPVFYGFFALSFYYLLSKGLEWNRKKSFFTALLFLLQPAVLRTGWDQLRLMLGFVFLFVLLARTKCNIISGAKEQPITVVVLSVLIVLSQQLTSVLFFIIVIWQLIKSQFKDKVISANVLLVLLTSAIIFGMQIYFGYIADPNYSTHFVPIQLPSGSGFFAFTNYFLSDPRFYGSGNYINILAYVGNLSMYVVIPLIPLVLKGFFRDKTFFPILTWLLLASYSILVFPWFALSHYWFWTFLLPIPLTVYAGNGLDRLGVFAPGRPSNKLVGGFVLLGILALGYTSSTISIGYPFAYSYMPPGLVKSCVDFEYIPDIEVTFEWTNANLPADALVFVPEKLQGFASMFSRADLQVRVAPPFLSFTEVLEFSNLNANKTVYAIYFYDQIDANPNIEILRGFGQVRVLTLVNNP